MNPFRSLFLSLSRTPPIVMLFSILGLAIVATMFVMNVINQKEIEIKLISAQKNQKHLVKVVYATKNIDEGEIIAQEALETRDVEDTKAPIDAFNSLNAVVGQQAAYAIPSATIVGNHALKPVSGIIGFDDRIKEGMRAITFGVDSNSGVAGFIAPGSHVDVVAITGAADSTKAAYVMSDVEVVAVGTTYQKAPGNTSANPAGSVTVAVTPESGIKLIKAVSAAKLYLSLRNDRDHAPIAVVDVRDLFAKRSAQLGEIIAAKLPEPVLSPPPPPTADDIKAPIGGVSQPVSPLMHEVEMWNGSKKDILSVPQG